MNNNDNEAYYNTYSSMVCAFAAPVIFPILYKLARALVSDDMRDKIHVLGGMSCKLQPLLMKNNL